MGREKIKVLLFDMQGFFLEEFNSISECAYIIGASQPQISNVISGQHLSVNGFQVRKKFENRNIEKIGDITGRRANTTIVGKYWNDRLICTYDSILSAAEKTGIDPGSISGSIIPGYKCNGFTFKILS